MRSWDVEKRFEKATLQGNQTITVDPSLSSFDGHPFFEEKAARAKALLKKAGLPKQFSKKAHS